ncbi:MAG: hypothetical protein LBP53_08990 [Candidatus Peribacteria bacterium]|jgi:hypothetical protein|nr:hypothetical protein [Candidatus Peribacteria bacterium]
MVLAAFSQTDGKEPHPAPSEDLKKNNYEMYKTALKNHLESLSTYERFLRFAQDFRKEENDQISYEKVEKAGKQYIKASYASICEFMSKKEYTGNRESEMHERFCDFAFSDWKEMLEKAGFTLHSDSTSYTNPRLIDNVRKGKVEIFEENVEENGKENLVALEYPPTNVFLIAEKPLL